MDTSSDVMEEFHKRETRHDEVGEPLKEKLNLF